MSMAYSRVMQHRSVRMYGGRRRPVRDALRDPAERICCDDIDSSAAEEWYGRGAMGVLGVGFAGGLHQPISRFDIGKTPLVSKKGARQIFGRFLLICFAALLAVMLLINMSSMLTLSNRVTGIRRDISDAAETNDTLQAQLKAAADSINVGYEAAQMGMVSTQSTDIKELTVTNNLNQTYSAESVSQMLAASAN